MVYEQGRIQDFAQGGDKTGAKRPKSFLSPPLAPQGGTGGDRIQEEGENQVTYQSLGIWMF